MLMSLAVWAILSVVEELRDPGHWFQDTVVGEFPKLGASWLMPISHSRCLQPSTFLQGRESAKGERAWLGLAPA